MIIFLNAFIMISYSSSRESILMVSIVKTVVIIIVTSSTHQGSYTRYVTKIGHFDQPSFSKHEVHTLHNIGTM